MAEKILLIDGYSILNRAFYGVPPLNNSKGIPTNGVVGFMNILYKMLEQEQPAYLAVAFDVKHPTFRHEMYPDYKGTRKPMPDDLHRQVPLLKDLLKASGIAILELPGYEADDIIGTVSKFCQSEGMEVSIVSGDRDLFQLVDTHITQFIPKTRAGVTTTEIFTPETVMETYGVTPIEFIDVKALQGDASDNIPGVPGVGEKTAQALIASYHSIENVLANIEDVKPTRAKNAIREHFDMAVLSRKLAEICLTAPLDFQPESARIGNLYTREAYSLMGELELKSLMKRFDTAAMQEAVIPADDAAQRPVCEQIDCDFFSADDILREAAGRELVAIHTDGQGSLFLCFDPEHVYRISEETGVSGDYIRDGIDQIAASAGRVITLDLPGLLRNLELKESTAYADCGIAAYLLNPLKSTYDCEDIARDYLGTILPADSGKRSAKTAEVCFAAWPVLEMQMREQGMYGLFTDVEMPIAFSLHRMELAGIRVQREALSEYGKKLGGRIAAIEQEIYDLAGHPFNLNSPKQLGELLFEELGLPGGKKTKTGFSTAADVLEKLKQAHPIIPLMLEYRTYAKLKSTYADGLAACIGADGRIHGHFQQTITATGRISSTEPNLQNIPVRLALGREIRKVFVPEEGSVFIDADYSQIELRVLAQMSGDERLVEAYNQAADIHRVTASRVFHVPFEEVTPEQRRNAKAVNFGIVYGISAFGLSEDLSISRKEANDYIRDYFDTYPGVKAFLDRQVLEAKNNGYVTTLYGRRRPVPELKSGNFNLRQFGERVAMNSPIQGTAADIIKIAMLKVEKALSEAGLSAKIVLQVHDELLVEAPVAEAAAAAEILKREMMQAVTFRVPLEAEVKTGASWYETK